MICHYRKDTYVPLSRCDSSGCMSIPDVFGACQDIATEHAEMIGVGNASMMRRGLFWLTARTRIRFYHRPPVLDTYTLETWPRESGATRCERFYRAKKEDRLLYEGRTEWCVWNISEKKPVSPQTVFDPALEYSDETVLAEPFARFRHDFSDEDRVMTYTILPSDIDLGRHMNNVAYPRLLINSFSTQEISDMPLKEMEVLFMMPCLEGDTLEVYRRKTGSGYEFGIRRADGRWAALASITLSLGE